MEELLNLDIVSPEEICSKVFFSEIVMVMISWSQEYVSSNSVCYHTHD